MPTLADLESKYFPGTLGATPHAQDTEVIAHIDGDAYFSALAAAITATNADDVIYMVNWYFNEDITLWPPAATTIKEVLAQKIGLGVDVRIVIWTGRNQLPDDAVEFGDLAYWAGVVPGGSTFKDTVESNMFNALTLRTYEPSAGVRPLEFRVLMDWSGNTTGSRHQKYAVVYNKSRQEMRAFVGGIDIGKDRQATPDHPDPAHSWHDAGVELVGEGARGVLADFKVRWDETLLLDPLEYILPGKGKRFFNPSVTSLPPISPSVAVIAPIPPTTNSVRIARSYGEKKDTWDSIPWSLTPPGGGLQQILAVYQKAINSATRYIYVEDQGLNNDSTLTSHGLLYPLIRSAEARGVKVVFVCGGEGADYAFNSGIFNEFGVVTPYGPPWMSMPNFRICRIKDVYVHSKILLIDDEFAGIGSANFWDRSMDGTDTELSAAIVDTATFVRDVRVRLMAEHFRMDTTSALHRSMLEDWSQAFGLFGLGTPTPSGFLLPTSRVYQLRDTVPSIQLPVPRP